MLEVSPTAKCLLEVSTAPGIDSHGRVHYRPQVGCHNNFQNWNFTIRCCLVSYPGHLLFTGVRRILLSCKGYSQCILSQLGGLRSLMIIAFYLWKIKVHMIKVKTVCNSKWFWNVIHQHNDGLYNGRIYDEN